MRGKFDWFPCYQEKMLEAFGKIEREDDRSYYIGVILLIYQHRGVLTQSNRWIGRQLNKSERSATNSRARLVNTGMLIDTPAGLSEPRAMTELAKQNAKSENRSAGRQKLSTSYAAKVPDQTEYRTTFSRELIENSATTRPDSAEKSKFPNENSVSNAKLSLNYREREKEREKEETPKPPVGACASGAVMDLRDPYKIADDGLPIYNAAADRYGWQTCRRLTGKRRRDLTDRINDIGGLDSFRRALDGAANDPWFNGKTFTIEFVLSTESKLADVLARLYDMSTKPQSAGAPTPIMEDLYAKNRDNLRFWENMIRTERPNGVWPKAMGIPPGHPGSWMSDGVAASLGLMGKYDVDGICRQH